MAFQKTNAKSLDRKTFSDQGLSAAPHFLKTIYFDLAPIINLYAVGKLVLTIFSEKTLYIEKKVENRTRSVCFRGYSNYIKMVQSWNVFQSSQELRQITIL